MNPHPLDRVAAMDEGREYKDSLSTIFAPVKKQPDPHTIARRQIKQRAGYATRSI